MVEGSEGELRVRRVYEKRVPEDGTRILVDRIWPRGIRKDSGAFDEWAKEAAPSAELRKWFAHDPERLPAFAEKYREELDGNPAAAELMKTVTELLAHGNVTLVYGAKDETDAKENIERFVANLPEHFRKHVEYVCGKDPSRYYNLLFRSDLTNHLYCELPAITKIPGYDHTPEGQAKFYNDILQHLYDLPYVCGTIIYCWKDPDSCHVCGQKDCPTETRWGLVDASEQPKPSFYAVRKIFGRIKWLERTERK